MKQTHSAVTYPSTIWRKLVLCLLSPIFCINPVFTQYQNVVINEISGDGGNIEAGNDAIVELAGPSGTDIGCMVITNTEWAVVLPAGTMIPADGVFSIGCEERDNNSTGFYTGLSTGISCEVCDFPGLVLDFDVCNIQNANYVSTSIYSTYGFTLDNQPQQGNKDGDQVILFRPDGMPHDAVYWGASDVTNANGGGVTLGGASGSIGPPSDHVSVQINHSYTLGDNDENGIVNDYVGSHIGYRANGGNAVGVNLMPTGNDDIGNPELFGNQLLAPPGDCKAHQTKYTVPALSDPIWVNLGLNLTSCNSTHIRLNDTSPLGNSVQGPKSSTTSSHMDDPDLNADWMIFDPSALVPSSFDATMAKSQWQITNHPNPGEPNAADSWDFFYDIGAGDIEIKEKNVINLSLCASQNVEFELRVYNYQHVEPTMRSAKLAGSFVRDETGIDQDWIISEVGHDKTIGSSASNNDGITTFNFTSNTLSAGMTHSFTLVWDDYTDCCGSGSNNTVVNQSVAHECYEKVKVNITVAEALTVSDNAIICPGDFSTNIGLIDFSQLVTSPNASIQYRLKEQVTTGSEASTGTIISTNTTGIFNLPTTLNPPVAVIIEDLANCGVNQIITIAADCRDTPPCPIPNGATINVTTVCPGEGFTLAIDASLSTDLPNSGTIDWYYGTTGFDPFNGEGTLLGQSMITTVFPPPPTTGPVINEVLVDAATNDGNGGEFIEIAGVPGTDLSCYILTDGDDEIILPDGTSIPPDGFLLIASGKNTDAPTSSIDIDLDNCGCFSDPIGAGGGTAADLQFTNHSATNGEFLFLYDALGTYVDGVLWGGPTAGGGNNHPDASPTHTITISPTGCSPPTTVIRSGQSFTNMGITSASNGISIELDSDVTGSWQTSDNTGGFTAGATNSGALPTTIVSDLITNVGTALCNQTIEIKGIVQPATITSMCTASMVTTSTLSLTIECPVADLQLGDKNLCMPVNPSEILATIDLSGGSGTYNTIIQLNYNEGVFFLNKNNVSNPLLITYTDLVVALGTANFSEVELTVNQVSDASGKMCNGPLDNDIVLLTVEAPPIGAITSASDLTDCSGLANGTVTFEFSPSTSGPWEFEYTINGGAPISGATNITPFVLPVSVVGTYELTRLANEAGCEGTIDSEFTQAVASPILLAINEVEHATVCNNGTEPIDLDTDILLNINDNGTALVGNAITIGNINWYSADPSLLPEHIRSSILLASTIFTPVAEQDYFFIYKRPSDDCEVIGKTTISLSSSVCCVADAGNLIRPTGGKVDNATGNQSICVGEDLDAFTNNYTTSDETKPTVTSYLTTFLLTNNMGVIQQVASNGNFDFSILGAGTYDVFVLNYRINNAESTISSYLAQLAGSTASGTGGNIIEIIADDMDDSSYGLSIGSMKVLNPVSFGTYCLDLDELDDGVDTEADKVQVIINAPPVVTVNDVSLCQGATSPTIALNSTSGNPTLYAIDYNNVAEEAGFMDVAITTELPTIYEIPAGVMSGTYSGAFKYSDTNSCGGVDNFTITINPPPVAMINDVAVCMGELSTPILLDIVSGNPTTYTLDYDEEANVAGFLDINTAEMVLGAELSIPSSLIEGNYKGSITYKDTNDCIGMDEFVISSKTAVLIEAGVNQTICSTGMLNLSSLGAAFNAGATEGTWTTSGTGIFDVEGVGNFAEANTYKPSLEDIKNGSIVITLTSLGAVSPCTNQSDDVLITFINVPCTGIFPWKGNN